MGLSVDPRDLDEWEDDTYLLATILEPARWCPRDRTDRRGNGPRRTRASPVRPPPITSSIDHRGPGRATSGCRIVGMSAPCTTDLVRRERL